MKGIVNHPDVAKSTRSMLLHKSKKQLITEPLFLSEFSYHW